MADVVNTQGLLILTDRKDSVFDGEIFASEYEIDARVRRSKGDVDAANARVGMRRAQEFAVEHAGKGNVVGEARLPGDFGAGVYSAAGVADYAEIAVALGRFLLRRILWLRH